MNYIIVDTMVGQRYFPKTTDEDFNRWNSFGYTEYDKMFGGYQAYLNWLEKKKVKNKDNSL